MTPTQTIQQADGHDQRILDEQELAGQRVVLESLDAADPAPALRRVRVPLPPFGYRIATIADAAPLRAGRRCVLLDALDNRIHHGIVRSWTGEALNIDVFIRLSIVDDDLEPLPSSAPVTDGARYWLLVEAIR